MAADPRALTVLIVDDEETILEFFTIMLRHEGFQVLSASNGRKAMSALHDHSVSLVILDLMMPGMNGYDILMEMQQKHPKVPVVICTSKKLEPQKAEELRRQAGVRGFWIKPIDQDRFRKEVHALLGTQTPPKGS
jgi:DNA-binding response OmpR family regulator